MLIEFVRCLNIRTLFPTISHVVSWQIFTVKARFSLIAVRVSFIVDKMAVGKRFSP
jgi:hypothetical protein